MESTESGQATRLAASFYATLEELVSRLKSSVNDIGNIKYL